MNAPQKIDISGNKVTIPLSELCEVARIATANMHGQARKELDNISQAWGLDALSGKTNLNNDLLVARLASQRLIQISNTLEQCTKIWEALEAAKTREELVIVRE